MAFLRKYMFLHFINFRIPAASFLCSYGDFWGSELYLVVGHDLMWNDKPHYNGLNLLEKAAVCLWWHPLKTATIIVQNDQTVLCINKSWHNWSFRNHFTANHSVRIILVLAFPQQRQAMRLRSYFPCCILNHDVLDGHHRIAVLKDALI